MAPNAPNLMALLDMAPSAFAGGEMGPLPHIKSLSVLRKEVKKWAEQRLGKLSEADLDSLVAWFNRNFFRLER